MLVNQSVRSVGLNLSMDPAMRSMLSADVRDCFPPSDCNNANKVLFNAPFWICSKKISKRLGDQVELLRREHLSKIYRTFFYPIKVWCIYINVVVFILLVQVSHFFYLFLGDCRFT